MLLSLSLLGIFLSLILLYFNAREYRSSLYLGLFFFFLSLYGFYQYILLYSKSVTLISLFLFNLSLSSSPVYLIGPMLYWYVRSVLTDNPKLRKSDMWHFIPALIFFVAAFPNTFIPWHEKVEVAKMAVQDGSYIMEYKATLLDKIFPVVFVFLSRVFLVLVYTLWSLVIFINYLRKKRETVVFSTQQFMKKWLFCLLGFMLILAVSQILQVIRSFEMHFSDLFFTVNVVRIISGAGLIGLLISPFFFPAILYGLPQISEQKKSVNSASRQHNALNDRSKQNFENEYLMSIGRSISKYMEENQPYLLPDCNLANFSKLVNIPAHHLAYYFREIKKQPFNDFRNEWRVNHAKTLIEEGKASEMTLEAIGSLSGFSSRNAFIADFKKSEGVPPGVYASRFN